jgi:hypothetical protein
MQAKKSTPRFNRCLNKKEKNRKSDYHLSAVAYAELLVLSLAEKRTVPLHRDTLARRTGFHSSLAKLLLWTTAPSACPNPLRAGSQPRPISSYRRRDFCYAPIDFGPWRIPGRRGSLNLGAAIFIRF